MLYPKDGGNAILVVNGVFIWKALGLWDATTIRLFSNLILFPYRELFSH